RDLVFNREPTKPAIGKVHSYITAQRPLRSDRKHVADDKHPDHQHWIDRWPTELRIIRCQLGMHPTQIKNRSDLAHRVIVRHRLIETKRIEKLLLVVPQPPHHRPLPSRIASQRRNHRPKKLATDFCNKICTKRTFRGAFAMSALRGKADIAN